MSGRGEMLRHKRHKRPKVRSGSASRHGCPLPVLAPPVEMCEESELSELSLGMAIRMDVVRSGCSREDRGARLGPPLSVTNGTICLPTRQVLAIVPFVTRRRLSPGLVWPGLSRGGMFPKLSKLLNQEDAWAHLLTPHPCCGQA
jgi:hypothetical protein